MDIVIFQSADPYRYARMLSETSRTVTEYCRRQGHSYESYIGIKRGPWPWEATYNRIIQLNELMNRGFNGWAVYMDADAYIVDLDFDLRAYLSDKQHYAAVLTPSMATDNDWDINAGVGLFNLGAPGGRRIVTEWNERFAAVSNERLAAAEDWIGSDDDQYLIQSMLRTNREIMDSVYLQSTDLMNSSFGTFIRQHLRGYSPTFEHRMAAITREVDAVMGGPDPHFEVAHAAGAQAAREALHGSVVEAIYNGVLGRSADQGGAEHAVSHLREHGVEVGAADLIRQMLGSAEYADRGTVRT